MRQRGRWPRSSRESSLAHSAVGRTAETRGAYLRCMRAWALTTMVLLLSAFIAMGACVVARLAWDVATERAHEPHL